MKKISVVGIGYIGLPTAAILASKNCIVTGIDINQEIVNIVNSGKIHFFEPGLEDLVENAVNKGWLKAGLEIKKSDVFIISVPTPCKETKGKFPTPIIDHVMDAADRISKVIEPKNMIILESTSPVGTTEKVASLIQRNSGLNSSDFLIAYCPERVFPGNIIYELKNNDRIVGGINKESANKAKNCIHYFV